MGAMVDLSLNKIDRFYLASDNSPDIMVDLPDAMVDLPDTSLDLLDMVDLPDTHCHFKAWLL